MSKPQFWYQESPQGLILFVVLYTKACRWKQCVSCSLYESMSKEDVPFATIIAQIDWLMAETTFRHKEIKKIIISNNGSVLDEETFPTTALLYLITQVNIYLPNLEVFCLESRPEYVDYFELKLIQKGLKDGPTPTVLEIAIGFEVFNDFIRNNVFKKGLTLTIFEKFLKTASKFNTQLKCYFMQKPVPNMSDQEAIKDIHHAIDYLDVMSCLYKAPINLHLNPTFVAPNTLLEKEFKKGNYHPPHVSDVIEAVRYGEDKSISIYVGLSDEGLSVPNGHFIRPEDTEKINLLEQFNKTQDFNLLS